MPFLRRCAVFKKSFTFRFSLEQFLKICCRINTRLIIFFDLKHMAFIAITFNFVIQILSSRFQISIARCQLFFPALQILLFFYRFRMDPLILCIGQDLPHFLIFPGVFLKSPIHRPEFLAAVSQFFCAVIIQTFLNPRQLFVFLILQLQYFFKIDLKFLFAVSDRSFILVGLTHRFSLFGILHIE